MVWVTTLSLTHSLYCTSWCCCRWWNTLVMLKLLVATNLWHFLQNTICCWSSEPSPNYGAIVVLFTNHLLFSSTTGGLCKLVWDIEIRNKCKTAAPGKKCIVVLMKNTFWYKLYCLMPCPIWQWSICQPALVVLSLCSPFLFITFIQPFEQTCFSAEAAWGLNVSLLS